LQAQQREQELMSRALNEQNIELEQQKKQLSQVNQIKSTFISSMGHELRTPLNSIIALSGVLNRHLSGAIPDEEFSYLEVIERNGKNLLNLINDVLDISRLEAGKQEVTLSRFSMPELVSQVTDMILPQARQKDIKLLTDMPEDLPSLISDQTLCRHILQNLVSNAVKFTDVGQVEVRGQQVGENIQIDVIDTGIGISAENLPYVFDEFRQGDEGNTRKYGGTGLGLSIARRYTDLLFGNLQVHSLPGEGTTFRLTLPIALDPAAFEQDELDEETWHQPSGLSQAGKKQTSTGKFILLVDDNEPALIQMTDMLSEQGYTLQVARNGHEALEQMGTHLPDAIILDLMMPKMDGFEVLSRLRDTELTSALPVLILTAKHISKEELNFLKKNNVHQLIQKGNIGRKELLDAVGKMVAPVASGPEILLEEINEKKRG
jgi:CheY-like chemotaxis protein/nitrogen-specific signal transduction histidine kinase